MKSLKQLIIFVVGVIAGVIGLAVVVVAKSDKIRSLISGRIANGLIDLVYGKTPSGESRYKYKNRLKYNDYKYAGQYQAQAPVIRDLIFDTRGAAEEVLSKIVDFLESYGSISIADVYSFAGCINYNFGCYKYGWTEKDFISAARIVRCKDEYSISLPRARRL